MGVRKGCRYAPVASPGRRAPGNGRKCRKYATEVGLREWSPVLRAPFRIERGVRCDRRRHGHVARTLGYPSVCVTGRGGPSFQVKSRSEREREHVDGGSRGESRRQVFAVCAVDQLLPSWRHPKKPAKSAAASKKPRAKPAHPKTAEMVNSAIKSLKERGGSSLQAIKKYITANYKTDAEKLSPFIKKYIKGAVPAAHCPTKGKGASGSFKLASRRRSRRSPPSPRLPAAKPRLLPSQGRPCQEARRRKKTAAAKKPSQPRRPSPRRSQGAAAPRRSSLLPRPRRPPRRQQRRSLRPKPKRLRQAQGCPKKK
ncbi:hypothetical protein BDA96_08G162600 [Sorghum bicolor]|uniref:H15 domain-containing protein n=1 Tax=Sorghum bicolor TaxID=4558 RepID=A0A921QGS5_SORBI|nr:hypothetical protein BDA96_08G162600 [Sorghum bicolor]